ncbi:MAG TPA: geranylgeranyl reductase family protein [Acidimicrobiales bacterium]|nr:geranylgeranyl reductase family protein [Acidimicrobiales bacterium]
MTDADLVVVGAGPAGCSAAVTAARAGLHVVMVDKATFPRDKCCGDGLTADALRCLDDLGLDPAEVPSWTAPDTVRLVSPSGREVALPLPAGSGVHAVVARRAELDAALVRLARDAGAQVFEDEPVRGVEAGPDGVSVETSGGAFRAPYVIAADGVWSPVAKALGAFPVGYLGEWHAARMYMTGVEGPAAEELCVWFEPELLPAYAWAFPLGAGTANVGVGVVRRPGRRALKASALTDLLDRPAARRILGPGARPDGAVRAWPIPTSVGRLSAAGGRVLFAGDAARAADPLTGEGVAQALESGRAAAAALAAAGPGRPVSAGRRYRRALAAGLLVDNRFASVLASGLSTPRRARAAVRVVGASPWASANFARWLFEDYPRAVLATPWRWHRNVLAGPGAFAGRTG